MTYKAYLDNVRAKAEETPDDYLKMARAKGKSGMTCRSGWRPNAGGGTATP